MGRFCWWCGVFVLVVGIFGLASCEVMDEVVRTLPVVLAPPPQSTPVSAPGRGGSGDGSSAGTGRVAKQRRQKGAAIRLSDARGRPGATVEVEARLSTGGASVAGAQNDLVFGNGVVVASRGARPDCTVNSAINKGATAFGFTPSGCRGNECRGVRVLIFSFTNLRAIPDGSLLYTCRVSISPNAQAGEHHLGIKGVSLSTSTGQEVPAQEIGATITVTR